MAAIDPESLISYCPVRDCESRFVPSEKQLHFPGKAPHCPVHRTAYRGQHRPWRKVYQLVPREAVCDGCGKPYIAKPQALVQQKLLHARLLCGTCCQDYQHQTFLICPCCAIIVSDNQSLIGCLVGGCPAQSVEVRRKTIPALFACPFPTRLWQQIIERSLASGNPERYRREAVAKRAVLGRRGKSQGWTNGERVMWR
jgi:hypothetical protein